MEVLTLRNGLDTPLSVRVPAGAPNVQAIDVATPLDPKAAAKRSRVTIKPHGFALVTVTAPKAFSFEILVRPLVEEKKSSRSAARGGGDSASDDGDERGGDGSSSSGSSSSGSSSSGSSSSGSSSGSSKSRPSQSPPTPPSSQREGEEKGQGRVRRRRRRRWSREDGVRLVVHRGGKSETTTCTCTPTREGWETRSVPVPRDDGGAAKPGEDGYRGDGEILLFTAFPRSGKMRTVAEVVAPHAPASESETYTMEWTRSLATQGARVQSSCVHFARVGRALERGSTWMRAHWSLLANAPLSQITVPGSHDSGSHSCGPRMSATAAPSWLLRAFAPKSVVRKWAVTQGVGIREQLEYGVRYLDFRVAEDAGRFRFVHTVLGASIGSLLDEVVEFSRGHPHEIIVVDINHIYLPKGDDAARWRLVSFLRAHPIMRLCAPRRGGRTFKDVTPALLVEEGTPIILTLCDGGGSVLPPQDAAAESSRGGEDEFSDTWRSEDCGRTGFHRIWSNCLVPHTWPRAARAEQLADPNSVFVSKFRHDSGSFFALQGIVTPGPNDVASSAFGGSYNAGRYERLESFTVAASAETCGKHIPQLWLDPPQRINAILLDFVEKSAALEVALELNRRRLGGGGVT